MDVIAYDQPIPLNDAGVGTPTAVRIDVLGLSTTSGATHLALARGFDADTGEPDGALSVESLSADLHVANQFRRRLNSGIGSSTLALWAPALPKELESRQSELRSAADGEVELVVGDAFAQRVAGLVDRLATPTHGSNESIRLLRILAAAGAINTRANDAAAARRVREAVAEYDNEPMITWAEVVAVHRTQRGIRAPRGGREASLVCNTGPHAPYPDQFVGDDVLRYVGRGQQGDQALDGDNESLRLAIDEGRAIRVFEAVSKNRYRDRGTWFGIGEPEWHLEPGTGRRLVVFVLRRARSR